MESRQPGGAPCAAAQNRQFIPRRLNRQAGPTRSSRSLSVAEPSPGASASGERFAASVAASAAAVSSGFSSCVQTATIMGKKALSHLLHAYVSV